MITILVVDDHPVVRDGVISMLSAVDGFEVVGDADNGVDAVRLTASLDPDVVVMDLRIPGGGGVDAVREMQRLGLRASVLVLTTYDTDSDTVAAIEAGATGYLLKDSPTETLVAAVRATAEVLFVSEATVKTHLAHVYEKLGVTDRAAAVATAYERGILG